MKRTFFMRIKQAGAVFFCLTLSACTSANSLLASRGHGGQLFVCQGSYSRIFGAAEKMLENPRYEILSQDEEKGQLVAVDRERGRSRIVIFFYKISPAETQVEIHSSTFMKLPLDASGDRKISEIHDGIHLAMNT